MEDTVPSGTEDSGGTGAGTGTEDPGPEGMARIPAGTAILGCTVGSECEGLGIWTVEITRDYWMDTHEVTREQFALLEERDWADGCTGSDCPVGGVTWYEAVRYANLRSAAEGLEECYVCEQIGDTPPRCEPALSPQDCEGYRLPTEAEWEYAARCGTDTAWAGSSDSTEVAWTMENSGGRPHPVGELPPNACGLYDMSGNMWEWGNDWYDLALADAVDPTGPEFGEERISRGGSWDFDARMATVFVRDRCRRPDMTFPDLGFRLVRNAD